MEITPKLVKVGDTWECKAPGTDTGYGKTDQSAFIDWCNKLNALNKRNMQ